MRTATLIEPYLGYRNIILIEKWDTKWEVEICGSGDLRKWQTYLGV